MNQKKSWSEIRGILLVCIGIATMGFYYSWWWQNGRLQSPWLILTFLLALLYCNIQILGNWILYLATHYRKKAKLTSIPNLTVDVLVTAYGEEHRLIERTLTTVTQMHGTYQTYLLDDGHDPVLHQMANRLGIHYLTRPHKHDAKAGNINAALPQTNGDIIVIFDIDHAPKPDFLQRALPYFADSRIGFVQVMLTFENEQDGWVARAAAESSLDFYNPTSIGADGLNSATLIGSNALIRRTAFEAIGGYKPGLAEDLATSIALHSHGWQSIYINEPLAPGYAPPDLSAWFTQQLKWARGVFELLLTAYPRHFFHLNYRQKLSYIVRMTYYWIGPMAGIHILLTTAILLWGSEQASVQYESYLGHFAPMAVMTILIRQLALRRWRHKAILHSSLQLKPMALVFATWPIYSLAWIMALLRIPLGFRLTPKSASGSTGLSWLLPQIVTSILLLYGIIKRLLTLSEPLQPLTFGFAIALLVPHLLLLGQRLLTADIQSDSIIPANALSTNSNLQKNV